MSRTFAIYFGSRFLVAFTAIFAGSFVLILLVDYLELMRRFSHAPNASAMFIATTSLYRAPQIIERILPFAVMVGAMSTFLTLSRRLELVVARAAGVSAWQFTAPAVVAALLIGVIATTVYNPVAAVLGEQSKRMEAELQGRSSASRSTSTGVWLRQRGAENQSIMNAATGREQGLQLSTVTVFVYDLNNRFLERIEAQSARLEPGRWRLENARIYAIGAPPAERVSYLLSTNLTAEQVQETFSSAETVPFWQLPEYISRAENAGLSASQFRLQYQKLLSMPFLLASMVLLAAAFCLRFFRFGGVQKMVLGGISSGFAIFVGTKLIDDVGKAEMLNPTIAAWAPVLICAIAAFVALLFLEDG